MYKGLQTMRLPMIKAEEIVTNRKVTASANLAISSQG